MIPKRLYCPDLTGDTVPLDAAESQHAARSLRLAGGDRVTLFDGRGHVASGVLHAPRSSTASRSRKQSPPLTVRIEQRCMIEPPAHRLTLAVAAPKGDRLRWMVEKCTELGVTSLIMAEFERSVVHPSAARREKLERYAIEACKQCGRAWLPAIECDRSALAVVESAPNARFVADLTPGATPINRALAACDDALMLIGPEGGIAPAERERLAALQTQTVSLGDHTLRVETAAISIAAVWASLMHG